MKPHVLHLAFICLVALTLFTRFSHLNWGAPYFFNPDERNIATSITQLSYPTQMNPHFFAYGSLPIYTIYFIGAVKNIFTHTLPSAQVSFSDAILISRILSAMLACTLPVLVYYVGKLLATERTGLIAAFLATTSVGLTQYAHFGTFEMWLTVETLVLFFMIRRVRTHTSALSIAILGVTVGCLLATKISTLPLLAVALVALLWGIRSLNTTWHYAKHLVWKWGILYTLLFFLSIGLVYFVTNPFIMLDTHSFFASINYEKAVATGAEHVFYTDEFLRTIPGVYQLLHVFPFLLTPLVSACAIPAFLYSCFVVSDKKRSDFILFTSVFLFILVPQLILYVKWTRYMVPTLPFFYVFLAIAFTTLFQKKRRPVFLHFWSFVTGGVCITMLLAWVGFFVTVYMKPDTRIEAAVWAQKNIPANTTITSEPYDLGLLPFNAVFSSITQVNFYTLEQLPLSETIHSIQQTSTAIILPSTRIARTRELYPDLFPNGSYFYKTLLADKLGYTTVYKTPCAVLCAIAYFGRPERWYEETAFVFDRPTVYILTKPL